MSKVAACSQEVYLTRSGVGLSVRIVDSSTNRLTADIVLHAKKAQYRVVDVCLVSPAGTRYLAREASPSRDSDSRFVFDRKDEEGLWKISVEVKGRKGQTLHFYKGIEETSGAAKDIFLRINGIRGNKPVDEEQLINLMARPDAQ